MDDVLWSNSHNRAHADRAARPITRRRTNARAPTAAPASRDAARSPHRTPTNKDAHAAKTNTGATHSSATDKQAPARPKSRYIPALDGLRTLAVVAVVLYHLNLTWAQGGLLGVTIFFVLSGYLITRLLLNEVAKTGRIDLKSFWIRRIRRLVPAVVTVVFVTCALCTIFNHVMLTKMRPDILPSLLFFNNWWQIAQNVSYFNALGDPSPLTHFWSLAIEEQFYLIWPPLLFAMVSMHVSKPNTRRVVLGLAAVSALAMMVLYNPCRRPQPRVLRHRHPCVLAAAGCLDGLYPRSRPGAGASRSSFGAQSPGRRRQARQERRGQAWREGRRISRDRPGTAERPRALLVLARIHRCVGRRGPGWPCRHGRAHQRLHRVPVSRRHAAVLDPHAHGHCRLRAAPREWLPARCPPSRSCGLASARTASTCGTIRCCCS